MIVRGRQNGSGQGIMADNKRNSAKRDWQAAYDQAVGEERQRHNRSGIPVKPLYGPEDWNDARYAEALGYPGQAPMTRGVYASMHRGRAWSQRQLVGHGTPQDYNERLQHMLSAGANALNIVMCNSFMRGFDADQVDPVLLGTCGTIVNTLEDMEIALEGVDIGQTSIGFNDSEPFTLLAMLLALARERGLPWTQIAGTSNQSDYLSHWAALHMYSRLPLAAARRVLTDHVLFCNQHLPLWNPISAVGQHTQQAGANPAEAMAFTIAAGLQIAEDVIAAGLHPDAFLPRLTFFFDISISFFEEIAKFRAGRRLWAKLVRERLGARDVRSQRFKFHAQTSGADLTRQQPYNNIARTALQGMAGIFGGLQSLHLNGYDEAVSAPTEDAARVAVSTANILRDEAHLADVIDPLGGSYYVETLTDDMEAKIAAIIATIDAAGGMYRATEDGLIQDMIGRSALEHYQKLESGAEIVVGVNAYQLEDGGEAAASLERPVPEAIDKLVTRLASFKAGRDQGKLRQALGALARAAGDNDLNIYEHVVEAAAAGASHGEIVSCLQEEMGTGEPLVAA